MATATDKVQCIMCNEETDTYNCRGCSKDFCFDHLTEHRQTFNQEFGKIENERNLLKQTMIEQKEDQKNDLVIQQINRWEYYSINKIKQTAEECRRILIESKKKYIIEIENKLVQLTKQMEEISQKNKFNEIDLNKLKLKLKELTEELFKSPNISTEQDCTSAFIDKISVISSSGKCDKHIQLNQQIHL
jgi:hypothetical protein